MITNDAYHIADLMPNEYIRAIKRLREVTSMGLKEAKDALDAIKGKDYDTRVQAIQDILTPQTGIVTIREVRIQGRVKVTVLEAGDVFQITDERGASIRLSPEVAQTLGQALAPPVYAVA